MEGQKFYGTYSFGAPVLVIRDPELVKQISVKEFHKFVDRQAHATLDSVTSENNKVDRIWMRTMVFARGL